MPEKSEFIPIPDPRDLQLPTPARSNPPAPLPPPSTTPGVLPASVTGTPAPTSPPASLPPVVVGDPTTKPAPAPDASLPPVTAAPAAGAPRLTPVATPTAPAAAPVNRRPTNVTSHEEEQYVIQPNDNFEDLSLKYYGTKAYARGLYDYNYAHPQTTSRFKQTTKIMVGEMIYIPERAYMERLYGRPQAPSPAPGPTVAPIAASPGGQP
jgi:hypothetical protein